MKRVRQKPFWIVFWSATVILLALAYVIDQRFLPRRPAHGTSVARNQPEPPTLTEGASLAPALPTSDTRSHSSQAAPPGPSPMVAPAPTAGPSPAAAPTEDLRDSARRAEAVDTTTELANSLFADQPNVDGEWTVNQQGLNQQDYQLGDGTYITSWLATADAGPGSVRAQEAQRPNGEVVDRWFNTDGTVSQVMRQYDRQHSITIYYYDNGDVEAMRVVDGNREIFTRYEHGGRLIERTVN